MIAIKSAIVIGLACGAALLMRRRSAARRHAVLAIGLGTACLIPALELVAPAWGVSMAPSVALLSAAAGDGERQALWTLWAAGAAVGIATLAIGLARLAWIRASARRDVPAQWIAMADEAAAEFGIHRSIALLETDRAAMAVTWGLVRPKIMLPRAARLWADDCLRAVLRHELAHVQRGDWAVQLAASAVTRAFWFNPLLWMASRWLRIESERACDDAVLNLGVDGADYAGHLIAVARTMNGGALGRVAPAAMGSGGFERRIAATLDTRLDRTPPSLCACLLVSMAFGAATLPIAGFGQRASDSAPSLLGVQRDVLWRFGGEERRFSIVSRDVSFWTTRIEGRVELQARLNVDGSLSGVRIVEPVHPDLASAAAVIVRHWRREPARVRGVPVEVPIRMTVDFRR